MRKHLLLSFVFIISFFIGNTQDFSNKGKDFWVGYGNHVRMFNAGAAETMQIYLTSDVSTSGLVTVASIGFSQTFTVTANQITVVNIPRTAALLNEGLYNHGIHITALKPIVAYGFIYVNAISGATVFLPTNTLGKEYYSLNYTQVSNETNSYSYFFVEAVEIGSTIVEITPSQTTKNGWPANVTQTITLTQGQIYQVLSSTDLTGSVIKSVASGTGGCKKIAVFCGSGKISIGCAGAGSSDNLYQQMYPASTWGKKYVLIPSINRPNITGGNPNPAPTNNTNFFRIYRPDPTSLVSLNGVFIPPFSFINNVYQFSSNQTNLVESDKSILVAQYFSTAGCSANNNPHDPDMIYLNPVEQTVSDVTVNSMQPLANTAITQHFINVVLRNSGTGVSSFKVDGVAPAPSLINTLIQDNNYAYLRIYNSGSSTLPLTSGAHRLTCDSGFNAIAYGFGSAESYGYSAGTNLKDLYQQISVQSQFGIESSPSICTNSPFRFRVSLPYCADSIQWNLSNLPGPPSPSNPMIYYLSCTPGTGGPDSTTVVNGKVLYWYSLPNIYTFPTSGLFPVTITAYNTGATQCGSSQDIDFELGIFDPPNAGFSHTIPGCPNEPVQFTDTTLTVKPNYQWMWNFGDPGSGTSNTSNLQNPSHLFTTSGPHSVTLTTTTTVGCFSNPTSKVINVPSLVNATISGTTALCQNASSPSINFTIVDGLPPYKINYTLSTNGGAPIAQTPIITSTLVNPFVVSSAIPGVYAYSITSIENATAAFCTRPITGQTATVTINPLPTATINGTATVCQNSTAPNITFTGSNGTVPYTFNYTINGSPQTATTTTGNSVTISAPTNIPGTFNYVLVSVTDASSTTCTNTASGTATVTVQPTSTATIGTSATICQNATAPVITFTAANGNAPYTFQYNINGGATQTITTTASSNSVTLTVPMIASGTFIYNLLSVQNSGTIICLTPVSGASATIIINPVPTATISGTATVCQNSVSPNITFTGANATAPYTFTYTINGGAPLTISTVAGSSITLPVPTTTPGVYVYSLTQVKDASTTQCIITYVNTTATVTVKQLASATIATNAATVCQASASPLITFTATGGQAPYTFDYTLNGSPATITTVVGNSITLSVSTTTPGTYVYTLVSVTESSTGACVQSQTGSTQVVVHPKPTASFTTVGPYCEQKSVLITPSFNITPTGSIVSWVWDYGDGNGPQTRPNGNPFTLTYPTAGVKTITFKTISDNGCVSNVFTQNVTIFSRPKAGFINPAACLADALAQFTDTSTVAGGGASIVFWEWDFGDGSPIFAGSGPTYQNPAHAYAAVGQKTVTLIVTSNSGCKDTVTQQFFINGEVTRAAFTTLNAANLCSNRPVQIQENSLVNVGGLIRTDIYWDYIGAPAVFDQDNLPTPGKIYTHSYPNLQVDVVYKVRYYAYSGFNGVCQKDTLIDVLVHASPVATFVTVPDVCLNGGPVVLNQGTASGGTAVYMGPGVTFAGGVYTFDPLATGVVLGTNNNVVYTVTSTAGCDSAKVQQVKVLAPPVVNTFTTVGNLCHNNAITFHSTYTNGDGTLVKWIYNWNDATPIQTMTTGADVTHIYTTTGSHTATLTLETGYGCRNIPFPVTFTVNPLPVPSYTFSNSVCLPSADVAFNNTTPNTASNNYIWSFQLPSTAPANTSTLVNPNHIYTTQGPFNTHLIATNTTTGCIDSTAVIVINSSTIHPEPVVQFNAIPDVCLNNGNVSFAALTTETSGIAGGPGVFTSVISGAITAGGTFNPQTAGVGTHIITYTWTSANNCPTSRTQNVKVLAPPVVNTFTTVGNTCENNSITFHNTVTQGDGNINTWIYDWGDGTPNTTATNGNDVTHTYLLPNTYTATLYVITDGLCKSAPPLALQVIVNPLPRPDFTYTDTTCLPQATVIFKNITPNIGNWAYNWNFDFPSVLPADQSTQVTNVPYTYTSLAPAHSVKLTATSGTTGCTLSIIKPISGIHPAPTASFNFNKPSVCLAQNVTVLDNSTFADGSPLKWAWNFGENASVAFGQIQPPYTYSTANTFNVKLTVTNSFGCTDDTIRPFTVYPYPVVNAGPDDFVLEGGTIALQGTASGNNLTYLWTANPTPSYLDVNNTLHPLASPKVDVTYKFTVTAQGGCTKADSVFIKVLKFPEIPNTFTPNNDGIHDFWEIKYLFTYPNNRVQVFTRTGQLVFESKGYTKPWDGNVNGKALPFDTYYYIIEPGNGRQPITGYVTIVK